MLPKQSKSNAFKIKKVTANGLTCLFYLSIHVIHEPSAIDNLSEEEEVAKTYEDLAPIYRKKELPKKNKVADAVDLLKQAIEKDPAKGFMQFVELMIKHNSKPTNNNNINFILTNNQAAYPVIT